MNYYSIDRHCLTLIFAIQKFRHYLLAHCHNLVRKSHPFKYLLSPSVMWTWIIQDLLPVCEFEITVATPKGLRIQVFSDLPIQFPSGKCVFICNLLKVFFWKMWTLSETCPVNRYASLRMVDGALTLTVLPSSRVSNPTDQYNSYTSHVVHCLSRHGKVVSGNW